MLALLLACHTDDGVRPQDHNGETEAAVWTSLPASCTAPTTLPPDPLTLVGELRVTQDGRAGFLEALDVEVVGDLAFVVGMGRMVIADVADPTAPIQLSGPSDTSYGKLHRVEPLAPGFVATSQREEGVLIWDVTDPSNPLELTTLVGEGMEGLAYVDGRLYVGVRDEGVRVYDVADPAEPIETGRGVGLRGTWELAATGDGWLYAADATLGLVPIDLSSPDAPVIGTPYPFDGAAMHVRYADDHVYVALGGDGVAVLDVGNRAAPALVDTVSTGGSVVMTAVSDGLLWAVDHESLTVFDLATFAPIQKNEVEQFALAVYAVAGRAYVGDWNLIEVWELAEESAPALDAPAELRHADGTVIATLVNYGDAPLTLTGATSEDAGVVIEVAPEVLPPGESGLIRLTNITTDTTICLASDDPDDPTRTLAVSSAAAPPAGIAAPDFALLDLDGQTWRLSEQLGAPVLLVYFATW